MSRRRALLIVVVLLGGCAAKKPSSGMGMAMSSDQLDMVRSSYKTAFPNASLGVVNAVLPDKPYAMVDQIDTGMLKEGQVLTFLDGNQKVVANGTIVKVEAASVTATFEAGARRPMVGDLAVKF